MLAGPHVILRELRRDDLPRLLAFNNDLEVELAGGGDPPMPQQLERLVADFDRETAAGGRDDARFAIEVDGLFIGSCGLFNWQTTNRTAELGIGIGEKTLWGKGLGRETVGLLLLYAFQLRNLRRVWLRTHGANERAIHAYLAAGFVEEGRLRQQIWSNGQYHDEVVMGILRDDWIAMQTASRQAAEPESRAVGES